MVAVWVISPVAVNVTVLQSEAVFEFSMRMAKTYSVPLAKPLVSITNSAVPVSAVKSKRPASPTRGRKGTAEPLKGLYDCGVMELRGRSVTFSKAQAVNCATSSAIPFVLHHLDTDRGISWDEALAELAAARAEISLAGAAPSGPWRRPTSRT